MWEYVSSVLYISRNRYLNQFGFQTTPGSILTNQDNSYMAGSGDPPCFSITGLWNAHFFVEEKRKLISIYLSQIRQSWRLVFWMMEVGLRACVWFSHLIYWKKWWKRIHRKGNQKCKNNQFCYSLHCGLWTTVVGHIFKPLNNDWNESNTVLSYW